MKRGGRLACVWHLGVSPSLPPSRHFFQRGMRQRGTPHQPHHTPLEGGREGGGKRQNPFAPLGEMGFIASTRRDGDLPLEFLLSELISSHCWDVTKEEYVEGVRGGARGRLGGGWEGSGAQGGEADTGTRAKEGPLSLLLPLRGGQS